MLHHPPAQRGAPNPRPPRRRRTPRSQPLLSLTLGENPHGQPLVCKEVRPGHWLVTVQNESPYGRVAHEYAYNPQIPRWIGERTYAVHGVVSPAVDLDAYHTTCWWDEEWILDIAAAHTAEQMSADQGGVLLTPWQHDWLIPGTFPARMF
ncbi:hypothetical protein [Nocardiopsis tropica]|uniref:DUF402 domain-containing protein n=1 Tax=Nocardiopsis tropica TaxID=109330 RepID=A0ABU7KZT4_9ACTN|nr:hypothetical protein [Nocardiopsis umidischolae]MEE2054784.1 hypothetical protein [Nocardiopsis umidischolae]